MLNISNYLEKGIDFNSYHAYIQSIVDKNDPNIPYFDYTKMNLQRMNRLLKTVSISDSLKKDVESITGVQHWIVLTESWCGDAAQTTPIFDKLAALNDKIRLTFLMRDENLELMDQFLTDGKSRSIPKLIVTDASGNVLFDWGPRPSSLQEIYKSLSTAGKPFDEISTTIHKWYAEDKTLSTQDEISELLKGILD